MMVIGRTLGLIVCVGLALCPAPSHAQELMAKPGQPFCQSVDDMQPYIMALIQKDHTEGERYACGGMAGGSRLMILEDLPSDSAIGHIARVRAFILGGGGWLIGYTLVARSD